MYRLGKLGTYRFSILFLRNDLSIFHATMIKRSSRSGWDMNGLNIWKIVFFARIKPTKTGCCCWLVLCVCVRARSRRVHCDLRLKLNS